MEFAEDQLTLAAADGYRISVRTIALEGAVSDPFDIIVPAQALKELGRIVDDDDETVTVFVNAKEGQDYQVLFECPGTLRSGTLLVSQLIEGNFPEYENIIPDRHDTRTVVDTALLLKACKRSQVFAREVLKKMYINITPGETDLEPGQINVFAQSPETGDDATDIEATVEGEGIEIVFNVNFVLDVLSVIDAPQVALTTTTAANPGTFRPVGEDEINFTHVIMPMNLTRDGKQQ
jgi:DNA polymerase-3 subunit beta